jgi:subtilase family serine protease
MNRLFRRGAPRARSAGRGVAPRTRLALEILEDRSLPSVTSGAVPGIIIEAPSPNSGPGPNLPPGFTPAQIAQAYGFNQVTFNNGTVAGNGSGQTIAIIDAYDAPTIASDLATFDSTYGLPAPPSFLKVNETGGTTYPSGTSWANEISLDVEWAHAVAPGANILLVEANTNSWSDMFTAVKYAAQQPGVSVVSMSWGGNQVNFDSYLQTPSGHSGVTFVASSGDSSALEYPADSPNVLAVGGTNLSVDSSGNYQGETGWGGSGGGICTAYSQPSYQKGVVTQSTTNRTNPDVAYAASNFPICLNGGWQTVGGTSCAAPQWAALIAIADQGRALAGKSSLDGFSQTLPALYNLASTAYSTDYHDITSGSSGSNSCGPGYDLVTGIGSPVANALVASLVSYGGTTSGGPTITVPASATPNPVTGTSTSLSVQASENGSSSGLSYAWSVTAYPSGAKLPSFANSAAASTTATFYQAGAYTFLVTVTDSAGHSATSSASVTVTQTLTRIGVAPSATSVSDGSSKQFTATTLDQFGQAMVTQPTAWTWKLAAGSGTLSSSGVYTAPGSGSGSATVQASASGLGGTASVTYGAIPAAPTNLTVTSATRTQVGLSWVDNATNATGYVIQRSGNGSSWTQVGTVGAGATTFTDNTVSRHKTYYYRVYAYNSVGNSAYSNTVTAVTPHIEVLTAPASASTAATSNPLAVGAGGAVAVTSGTAAVPDRGGASTPDAATLLTTDGKGGDGSGGPCSAEQAAQSPPVAANSLGGLSPGRPGARPRWMQGGSPDASSGSDLGR